MSTLNTFKKKGKKKTVNPLTGFKRKLQRESLGKDQQIIFHPSGMEKMSGVLLEFIEPYVKFADTDEAYRKLVTIAIVAWNAALLSPEKREEMINNLVKGMKMGFWERRDFRRIMGMMIKRKLEHFAENNRLIVNYELQDLGDQIHLSVASTLAKEDRS